VFGGRSRRKEYWYFVLFNIINRLVKRNPRIVRFSMFAGFRPGNCHTRYLEVPAYG
jgi:uncharacterized membrane protein YhaH (DUF805 family)